MREAPRSAAQSAALDQQSNPALRAALQGASRKTRVGTSRPTSYSRRHMKTPVMKPEMNHWEAQFVSWCVDQPTDAAHDVEHLRRVAAVARRIAADEGAALEVVIPAAWLHDCVYVAKDSPDRARASQLSAEHAVLLLSGWGYPSSWYEGIVHAIEAHSFSAAIPARTIEARVVRDADRLDAIGAVGESQLTAGPCVTPAIRPHPIIACQH